MTFPITGVERYTQSDGRLTPDGQKVLQEMQGRLDALEAKLEAIAAVSAPSGGSTIDAEARTALSAVITAAG